MFSTLLLCVSVSLIWVGSPSGLMLRLDGAPVSVLAVERAELRQCDGSLRVIEAPPVNGGALVLPRACLTGLRIEGLRLADGAAVEEASTGPHPSSLAPVDASQGLDLWSARDYDGE